MAGPRGGNDREGAIADIESQYGPGHQSAADLLDAHDASYDMELQRALSKQVDEPATAALDLSSIRPAYDGTVQSAAIRGGRMVVVEETPDGRLVKWHKDVPAAARRASAQGAAAGAVPSTQQQKAQTATGDPDAGSTPPGGDDGSGAGTGDGDAGAGDGADGKAPKEVTVTKIEEQLAAEGTTPDKSVTKKDDLWALVSLEGQKTLVEAAGAAA